MSKLPALAAALLSLAAMTSGCVVDMVATADLPSGSIYSGRSTGMRGPAVIIHDEPDIVVAAPARRAPAPAAPTAVSSDARNPVIQSFTANPGNHVPAGQPITFQVVAHDPGNQPMQFNWASTGGTLTSTSGQIVTWNPPEKAGLYTVTTIITNARGGAVTGSQNLIVQADGSVQKAAPTEAPKPVEAPVVAEMPAPAPVAQAKPKPAPVPVEPCDCDPEAPAGQTAGELDEAEEMDVASDEEMAGNAFVRWAKR